MPDQAKSLGWSSLVTETLKVFEIRIKNAFKVTVKSVVLNTSPVYDEQPRFCFRFFYVTWNYVSAGPRQMMLYKMY